jgi:hypothetical protein
VADPTIVVHNLVQPVLQFAALFVESAEFGATADREVPVAEHVAVHRQLLVKAEGRVELHSLARLGVVRHALELEAEDLREALKPHVAVSGRNLAGPRDAIACGAEAVSEEQRCSGTRRRDAPSTTGCVNSSSAACSSPDCTGMMMSFTEDSCGHRGAAVREGRHRGSERRRRATDRGEVKNLSVGARRARVIHNVAVKQVLKEPGAVAERRKRAFDDGEDVPRVLHAVLLFALRGLAGRAEQEIHGARRVEEPPLRRD